MTYACTKLGYKVFITDISSKALIRMQNFLYPLDIKNGITKLILCPTLTLKS